MNVTLKNYRASKVNTNVNPTETTKRNKKKLKCTLDENVHALFRLVCLILLHHNFDRLT